MVTMVNGTSTCTTSALNGNLVPLCLSKKAEHRGTVTIAGVAVCENYVERDTVDKDKIVLDILFAKHVYVPVRIHMRGDKPEDDFYGEYWNFDGSKVTLIL
jgi:hypothetical protein